MDYDINKLKECGIDTEVGIEYTGSEDKYLNAIKRYYNAYESNRKRITDALSSMNIDDYIIIVHSLKSNSRMIGAGELSSCFEALEMAARNGKTSVITSDTNDVLNLYDTVIKQLEPIGRDDDPAAASKISYDEAQKTIEELLEALDEYEDERSSELVSKLAGYPFGEMQRDMLNKAAGYIGEFMYDEAADIIKQISAAI